MSRLARSFCGESMTIANSAALFGFLGGATPYSLREKLYTGGDEHE